jgi:glycosyltransferase involved in cell wall biosynthesis
MEKILVSILINNYNYSKYLGKAIDSVLNQDYPYFEVIVVDDGSTDNSKEIISSYQNKIIPVLKENGGQASAFNAGFSKSTGDIICFLDSDDSYSPNKIKRIVDLFSDNPLAGWIFHGLDYIDAEGKRIESETLANLSEFQVIQKNLDYFGSPTPVDYREPCRLGKRFIFWAPGPTGQCFRRSALEKILPMPEAESVTLGDRYVEYAAFYVSAGLQIPDKFAFQRIHGNNIFTFRKDAKALSAIIGLKTAYYLRQNFPDFERHTDQMFASSLGQMIVEVGLKKSLRIKELKNYIDYYLDTTKYFIQGPRLILNIIRSANNKLKLKQANC